MALALDIMKGGFSSGQAKALQGQANGSVAAAGTAQGSATTLKQSLNVVTSGTGGVILPSAEIIDEVEVMNLTSAAITVYPPTGERINALAANAGFLLASNTAVKVKKFSANRWAGFLSA